MKRFLIYLIILFSISLYFVLTLFILPDLFLSNTQPVSQPYFDVSVSESELFLGESFRIEIESSNKGDYGDIHIVSVAFPDLIEINDIAKIVTYDFTQSPSYFSIGDEIGSKYSGGLETTLSKYPSIEAMSRPVQTGSEYNFHLVITPDKLGEFLIFVKSVNIPHTNDLSHYPNSGTLDHQDEFVSVFSVNVNP